MHSGVAVLDWVLAVCRDCTAWLGASGAGRVLRPVNGSRAYQDSSHATPPPYVSAGKRNLHLCFCFVAAAC